MQLERIGVVGAIAGVVLGGLVAAAGCEGKRTMRSAARTRQSCRADLDFITDIAPVMPAMSGGGVAGGVAERRVVERVS